MTARHDTTLTIARRLAKSNSKTLHKLTDRQRLLYEILAEEIVCVVENRMRAQGTDLAAAIKRYWELPA